VTDFDWDAENLHEEQARYMVRTWGEEVLRQVRRLRKARARAALDDRNYGRLEDWSPGLQQVEGNYRQQYAAEHLLVWTAHQLERWDARLRRERGEDPRPEDPVLKLIRDALEHLDEADFDEGDAVPPPPQKKNDPKGRALRQLPAGRLPLTLGAGDQGLGGISSREVEQRALALVNGLDEAREQAAIDSFLEDLEELRELSGTESDDE
jgi:hypothetical protein